MRVILNKLMIKRCLFILLCMFCIWFAAQHPIRCVRTKKNSDDNRTKIGVLFLFNRIFSVGSQSVNYQLSDEKYVYAFYDSRKVENGTIWNVKSGAVSTQSPAVQLTEYVNQLAEKAYTDGMDYLILITHDTVSGSFDKYMAIHLIQKLKEHIIHNIGVIVDINAEKKQAHETKFIAVHKSHMEIFPQFFPRNLSLKSAIEWVVDVYSPYHITNLNSLKFNPLFRSVQFELKETYFKSVISDRKKVSDYITGRHRVYVVSYSLYGSDTRYTDGALANTELIKRVYPNWLMWIYFDDSVPKTVLTSVCGQNYTICINMTGTILKNRMTWRFLVASAPFVLRYIVGDIDSRLSEREKAAVDEWVQSGERFHVMRDHPAHSAYPISGGMWGGTREAIPNMKDFLEGRVIDETYLQDMNFLSDIVWPIANTSVFQHDSFSCDEFGGGHPFPTRRTGLEHVGSVYINGEMRKIDTDILKNTDPSKNCTL